MQRDLKRECNYEEKKEEKTKYKYSEMRKMIKAIPNIGTVEEFDFNGKRFTFFLKEDTNEDEVIESIEKLPFVDMVKTFKKIEVR